MRLQRSDSSSPWIYCQQRSSFSLYDGLIENLKSKEVPPQKPHKETEDQIGVDQKDILHWPGGCNWAEHCERQGITNGAFVGCSGPPRYQIKLDATEENRGVYQRSHEGVAWTRPGEVQGTENGHDPPSKTEDFNTTPSNRELGPDVKTENDEETLTVEEDIASESCSRFHFRRIQSTPRPSKEYEGHRGCDANRHTPINDSSLKSIGGNLGIGIGPTDSHRSRDSATAYPYPRNGLSDGENNTAALLRSPKRTSHFFLEPLFIGQRTGSFSSSSDLSEVSSDYLTVSWNGSTSPTELSEYLAYPGVSSRSSSPTPIESPQEILYVDPWSLEHNPNPVIFAHLGDSLYSVGPELHGVLANSPECDISTVHDNKRGRIPKTYFDLEPYKHTDLDYSEVTSLPSPADVEFNSDMARASTIDPSYISIRTQDKWSENAVPEISGSPPTTKALDIRPRSAACEDLVCEQCHITFQTIGLKNKHDNRKHVRRFACTGSNCTARFNLKADLQRHKSTVHKDTMTTLKQDTWSCTNAHCHLPGKLFTRKDNFQRHLVRCQNAQ